MEIIKNGYLECDKGFITSGLDMGKTIQIPVYCYLIKHPKGNVLIDSGFKKEFELTWGKRLKFFKPILEKDIVEELNDVKIDFIINTHLHIDHAENNAAFPDATILIQKDEYDRAKKPPAYDKLGYADEFEDLNYQIINGEHDVFGDGTIKIIPTPGHTKGHQSVLVVEDGKKSFLAGDACYTKENLDHNILPGIMWNADEIMKNYELVRKFQSESVTIFFGHQ